MRTLNTDEFYSMTEVSNLLGINRITLYRYYDWWKNPNFAKPEDPEFRLPEIHYLDRIRAQYIKKDEIEMIRRFRQLLGSRYRGAMAEYNAVEAWGKTGQRYLERRGKDYDHQKSKLVY